MTILQRTCLSWALAWIAVLNFGPVTLCAEPATSTAPSMSVEMTPRPVSRLDPGIVVSEHAKHGWSHLVMLVNPRLGAGKVDSLPQFAQDYAAMFKLTILANVKQKPAEANSAANNAANDAPQSLPASYVLDKVGLGMAMSINGKNVVVTKDTANQHGAELGMIDRSVLGGNESSLDDVIQVARTPQLVIFDAKANMLVDQRHEERTIRHFLWVAEKSGNLGCLVWLLNDGDDSRYQVVEPTFQLLQPRLEEDRVIHVSDGGFLSSVPTPDRFAMVKIPQGIAVPFASSLQQVAGLKQFDRRTIPTVVQGVNESLKSLIK